MSEPTETSGVTDDLRLVRQGTAFFAKSLDELPDDEFVLPSLLPGWKRSHVIAHVGYNALALRNLMGWAATGTERPMYETPEARDLEIERGSALSPHELRTLYRQSAAELDAAWAAMTATTWNSEVRVRSGRMIPASKTLWMRSREVWLHTVDLNSGVRFSDLPAEFLNHLLADVLSTWRQRRDGEAIQNFILQPVDGDVRRLSQDDSEPGTVLHGTTAALASWATGRSGTGVGTADGSPVPAAPAWL